MKIGILTLPLHTNYGGILQAYALQTVLERMGHEVRVIDYDSMKPLKLPLWKMPLAYSKRIIKNIIGRRTPIFLEQKINQEKPIIRQYTNSFIHRYINQHVINNFSDIKDSDYDAYVVGSDQVWRPKYFAPLFKSDISNAYLNFATHWNVKRLSYAASFGVATWEYNIEQSEKCKNLISRFDAISVREHSGVDLCQKYLDCDAVHVLDPTMLLDKEDYMKIMEQEGEPVSKGDLFTYILDASEDKQQVINQVASEFNLIPFSSMPGKEGDVFPPVTQWLRAFMDAKFVVCDSFHGAVFSIIFNKPFVVIGNKERGMTRFNSLLDLYDLTDRMITD